MAKAPDPGYRIDPLPEGFRGPGLRVRFSRIRGVTRKGVLERPLYLPVALGEFTVEESAEHRDYSTVAAGEFSVPASGDKTARQLRTTELETLTIDWHRYARWLANTDVTPEEVREELERILRYRTPFQVLATLSLARGAPSEIRMRATLRSMRRTLRPGERDTRYFTLELKEWRDNRVTRRQHGGKGHGHKHKLPTTAELTGATSLWSLARHFYGSASPEWRAIARANGIRHWGPKTPLVRMRRFKSGDKVKIPRKPVVGGINQPGED